MAPGVPPDGRVGLGDGRPAAGGLRADDLALPDGAGQRPADRPGAATGVLRADHRRLRALAAGRRLSGAGRGGGDQTPARRVRPLAHLQRVADRQPGPRRRPSADPHRPASGRPGRAPRCPADPRRVAARVLPGRVASACRPDARGVRRLLVPGLLLQPGGDLRSCPDVGAGGARRVDRAAGPGGQRAGRGGVRGRRHAGCTTGSSPAPGGWSTTSTFRTSSASGRSRCTCRPTTALRSR